MADEKTNLQNVPPGLQQIQATFGPEDVKKLQVRDSQGRVIGGVSLPDEPPGPSGLERIQQGIQQRITDGEVEIIKIVEGMAAVARSARSRVDRTSQYDFSARLETEKKLAEFKAEFDAAKVRIREIQKTSGMHNLESPFLKSMNAFLLNLERHFKPEEAPFSLNRF